MQKLKKKQKINPANNNIDNNLEKNFLTDQTALRRNQKMKLIQVQINQQNKYYILWKKTLKRMMQITFLHSPIFAFLDMCQEHPNVTELEQDFTADTASLIRMLREKSISP